MKILLFEDNNYNKLFPLSMLRGVYDVKCGALTLLERLELLLNGKHDIVLHCRKQLEELREEESGYKVNEVSNEDHLFLNGRIIFDDKLLKRIFKVVQKGGFYTAGGIIIAAFVPKKKTSLFKEKISSEKNIIDSEFLSSAGLKEKAFDYEVSYINYPWDAIKIHLSGGLQNDIRLMLNSQKRKLEKIRSENFIEPKKIFIEKNAKILPQVVIDTTEGEVLIEEGTTIEPFTFIKGPVYIGKNCTVKSGAKIYGPCSIGDYSKVAGEIAESIFHSYVNKQHDGFVGHSYICPFVNLGADTITSDLKNNYSKINMRFDDKEIETGMQFLGSIIGDHSKTAINTMLNTGTIIGIFSNVFGGGFPDKKISSFSWLETGKKPLLYDIEKALSTAKVVMKRRNVELSKEYENVLRIFYKETKSPSVLV